jgi:hypothetical protein
LSSSPGVNASIARWISRRFAPVPSGIRFLCAPYFTYAQNFGSLAEKNLRGMDAKLEKRVLAWHVCLE